MRQAWAPSGRCFAVSTNVAVHVLSPDGRELWRWKFRERNRLIWAGTVAVSPTCDAVAVGGTTDYKYIWVAQRQRGSRSFKVSGTPTGVAFSLDGGTVGARIATFYSNAYLAGLDGTVRWQGDSFHLPIRWPFDVRIQGDPGGPAFATQDALQLLESRAFAFLGGRAYSADGHWAAVWSVPNHSPNSGTVELWGAGSERRRWIKAVSCPGALVTADGQRLVVQGEFKDDDVGEGAYECKRPALHVLDRDGHIVKMWPIDTEGELVDWALSDRSFWFHHEDELREYDLDGRVLRTISALPQADVSMSPDRTMLLVREGTGLRIFRLPQ